MSHIIVYFCEPREFLFYNRYYLVANYDDNSNNNKKKNNNNNNNSAGYKAKKTRSHTNDVGCLPVIYVLGSFVDEW